MSKRTNPPQTGKSQASNPKECEQCGGAFRKRKGTFGGKEKKYLECTSCSYVPTESIQ